MVLGPVQWQIELGQTGRGELDGFLAFEDRLDQPRAQESQADEAPDVASADAVTPGQFLKRSSAPSGQLSKPCTPARERLDQRRVIPDARLMPRFIVSNGSQCRRGGSTFRWHRDVR